MSAPCIILFSPLHTHSFALTCYEYKDQSLLRRMYMTFFFFYQLNFQQFQAMISCESDLRGGKFYQLPSQKENTAKGYEGTLRETIWDI